MGKKGKKSQSRLTFEPVNQRSSSPATRTGFSPAKVRFSGAPPSSSPRAPVTTPSRSSAKKGTASSGRAKTSQSRLDHSFTPPQASFMPQTQSRRRRQVDSSDESAAEIGGVGDEEDNDLPPLREREHSGLSGSSLSESSESDDDVIPIRSSAKKDGTKFPASSQSVSTRLQRTTISDGNVDDDDDDDDDDDEEDEDPVAPSSSMKRKRAIVSSDEDEDDAPVAPSSARSRKSRPALIELSDSDDEVIVSSPKKRKTSNKAASRSKSLASPDDDDAATVTPAKRRRLQKVGSSPVKKTPHKGHRSEKQKKMELLKRRRAGERIEKLTSSESESDEDDKKGIYDTDSADEFEVLKKFDDESDPGEEEEEAPAARSSKNKKKGKDSRRKKNKSKADDDRDDDHDDNLDGFVTSDDEAPLGAPSRIDMPLMFTSAAHKPLKEQFPYIVEWLVHSKLNPAGFDRRGEVYVNAWRKLDDEFRGLANSKFTSTVWRADFSRALKGRPKLNAFELPSGSVDRALAGACEACGRSGHPATWMVTFQGHAYHEDTLEEVESDSDSDDEDDDDDKASVDAQGNTLPPISREWRVGAVCSSNAETAHALYHWKYALKEWVEDRLEGEGHMKPEKLREREKMKAKKRRKIADAIVTRWIDEGRVASLYGDFKGTLEEARNKPTTGRGGGRWR
ncbi:hypothetical protein F4780DRAFT_730154 [Xylariomycetidae sp. FL0641]|nr:hypothetical protein F4780DRAFT_730154 [Xylariomycetidae sp. FL0641]